MPLLGRRLGRCPLISAAATGALRLPTAAAGQHDSRHGQAQGAARRALSMRVVGEEEAGAMLEHWCVGLRSVLMSSGLPGPLNHDASIARLRELREAPPAAAQQLEPFWSVLYLSVAFESELLQARQSGAPPDVVLQIGQLAASCADAGLLQFSDSLLIAEWLNSQLAPDASGAVPPPFSRPLPPVVAASVSPWTLFATPTLAAHVDTAAASLHQQGYAVIDGFLGGVQAGAVAAEFRSFVGDCAGAMPPLLQPGELDETKRSQPAVRGDLITWLLGAELAPQWSCVGGLAQLLRTQLLTEVRRALAEQAQGVALVHEKNFLGKAMLTVYPPGAVGFAPHTDRADGGDLRKISAVYYLNRDWREEDGGQLRLTPTDGSNVVSVLPELDRLVLFWSDTVEHEVVSTSPEAPPRLAVSFWFHEDLSDATDGETGGAMSPLLEEMGR